MCMMTMLGGDLYLHSWGLTCSIPPGFQSDHGQFPDIFVEFTLQSWRFQSSSGVLVLFFFDIPSLILALQISKAMAEPSKSPTLGSVESKSSRRRKSPPQGWWKSWCGEENGNEKLIMCHARWKMQHENASNHAVTVSVAICSLIYKCVCIYIYVYCNIWRFPRISRIG